MAMDNDQLLQEIRNDMAGMETRLENHIDLKVDTAKEQLLRVMVAQWDDFHGELKQVNIHLEPIDRRLELHAGALAHIVEWSNKCESEMVRLSKELADVQARLSKLENPAA